MRSVPPGLSSPEGSGRLRNDQSGGSYLSSLTGLPPALLLSASASSVGVGMGGLSRPSAVCVGRSRVRIIKLPRATDGRFWAPSSGSSGSGSPSMQNAGCDILSLISLSGVRPTLHSTSEHVAIWPKRSVEGSPSMEACSSGICCTTFIERLWSKAYTLPTRCALVWLSRLPCSTRGCVPCATSLSVHVTPSTTRSPSHSGRTPRRTCDLRPAGSSSDSTDVSKSESLPIETGAAATAGAAATTVATTTAPSGAVSVASAALDGGAARVSAVGALSSFASTLATGGRSTGNTGRGALGSGVSVQVSWRAVTCICTCIGFSSSTST